MSRMTSGIGQWSAALILCIASGCATLHLPGLSMPGQSETSPLPTAATQYPPPPMVALEFHPMHGKSQVEEIPLEPGMTISDAFDKTKAGKRFRRLVVDLQRTHGGTTHKMPINFDNGKDRVSHSTNYALHPHDRIIIREDPSTALDDLMNKFLKTAPPRRR
jgi:hypothetical protein